MNTMTFQQIAAVLNEIQALATGSPTAAGDPINAAEFVSVANTLLQTGYDTVLDAINQVLTRTIFSIRPYSAKFRGLEISESAWGNHVRKLSIADKPFQDDGRYAWPMGFDATKTPANGDGQSVDQYAINKPDILQTNFYGASVYENSLTIFRDQLQQAFRGPDEFGDFLTMVMTNRSDKLEQARENMARATLAHLMASVAYGNPAGRVIHLLTEYNQVTGLNLTEQTVYQPANYKAFVQWMYSRLATVASLMTERSQLFQAVIDDKPIYRHTPYQDMRVYLYAPARYQADMMAIADVYHDSFLRLAENETVNFWQSITNPASINMEVDVLQTDGSLYHAGIDPETGSSSAALSNVYGVIMDREAAGYAVTQSWSEATPFNAKGGYSNIFDHATLRCYNDPTEKAVVLLLD